MKITLVGAGAVGLTYAWMLRENELTFFVRPARLGEPSVVHPLQEGGTHTLDARRIAAPEPCDQLWLCTSSPALRTLDLAALTKEAGLVVLLMAGLGDRALILEHIPKERLVQGMIPFIAWQTPLPGQERSPGVAFWFPPMMRLPFAGPRASEVADLLPKGKVSASVGPKLAAGSAVLLPAMAYLELAGWKLRDLDTRAVSRAAGEARAIVASHHQTSAGLSPPALALAVAARAAPALVPFPLEAYLRMHFTKVGDQTRKSLGDWVRRGSELDLPTTALQELQELLD